MNDVLVIVLCLVDVTKPAYICTCVHLYHRKFQNHETVSLQITRWSLIGALMSLYYSNIYIFFSADFQRAKFCGEFD